VKTDFCSVSDDASPETGEAAVPGPRPGEGVTVLVCHSCRRPGDPETFPRPGTRLAEATERAARDTGVTVRRVGCLGNCNRGISAAMLRQGSWSYVFGDLTEDGAGDLVKGALLYAGAGDGFMPFRARPEALRRGLIARLPTLDILKDIP
jgi:predicted metal-binding protein